MLSSNEFDDTKRTAFEKFDRDFWRISIQKMISTANEKETTIQSLVIESNVGMKIMKNLSKQFNAANLSYKQRIKNTNDSKAEVHATK